MILSGSVSFRLWLQQLAANSGQWAAVACRAPAIRGNLMPPPTHLQMASLLSKNVFLILAHLILRHNFGSPPISGISLTFSHFRIFCGNRLNKSKLILNVRKKCL